MDTKRLNELSQEFRKGAINRRAFIQNVVLTAGGAVAASHLLKKLGFDAELVREARAENGGEIIEDNIVYPSSEGDVNAFLARPAQGGPFPTMIVIHEIFGLSEFVKEVARLFARTGYLALAPALPEGGGDLPDGKHAQWMLDTIKTGVALVPDDEQVKLAAGFEYLTGRTDVDATHIGSVGFCWGGARSFTLATRNPNLWAAVVFYGSPPPVEELANIRAPVLGLYGALDNNGSVTSPTGTAAATARAMASFMPPKVFEWEVYNRAPHGFFRGDMPPGTYIATTREAGIARDLVFDFLYRYY
jgi:carboxymethylenebutenolidase